jgi:hypothetical protein
MVFALHKIGIAASIILLFESTWALAVEEYNTIKNSIILFSHRQTKAVRSVHIWVFLAMFLFFSCCGCSALVCRHDVLSHAGWVEEHGLKYQIAVYKVNPLWSLGVYNAHAQIKTEKGWLSFPFGFPTFSDNPTYSIKDWVGYYDVNSYMLLMSKNCFNNANCRSVGIP